MTWRIYGGGGSELAAVLERAGEASGFPDVEVYLAGYPVALHPERQAILVELGTESLSAHLDPAALVTAENLLGFGRYANGDDTPSRLVEIVRHGGSGDAAVNAARQLFAAAGLETVVCTDQPGRIVDRLIRPVYNAAMRFVDEGLASQPDLDLTCRLGLGYPDGPVERVARGGLAYHYDVTSALFETFGTPAFAPSRESVAAAKRRDQLK